MGENKTKKPGMMDFVNKAKWDAWSGLGTMSQVTNASTSTPTGLNFMIVGCWSHLLPIVQSASFT